MNDKIVWAVISTIYEFNKRGIATTSIGGTERDKYWVQWLTIGTKHVQPIRESDPQICLIFEFQKLIKL